MHEIGYQTRAQLPENVKIVSLLLAETGTYNPQYLRPYESQPPAYASRYLEERINGLDKINEFTVAGVASRVIQPSANAEGVIEIASGWAERRVRFMMVVEISSMMGMPQTELVLGYTDHPGFHLSGTQVHFDHNMVFYINSVTKIRTVQARYNTPMGFQSGYQHQVTNASHILVDHNWSSAYNAHQFSMRPYDMYAVMTRNHLSMENGSLDTRNMVTAQASKSRRSNALPTNYLASLLEGYRGARSLDEFGASSEEVLQKARGTTMEASLAEDGFISAISQVMGLINATSFRYGDLLRLDGTVDDRAQFVGRGTTQQVTGDVHFAGQTEAWSQPTIETQVAAMLSQAVPALMMDRGIIRLHFQAHNRTIDNSHQVIYLKAGGVIANQDLNMPLDQLEDLMCNNLLRDLSQNGELDYAIEMNVDLVGETWVNVSIQGGPSVPYVTPSFCDALMSPVLTGNDNRAVAISSDLESLFLNVLPPLQESYSQSPSAVITGQAMSGYGNFGQVEI